MTAQSVELVNLFNRATTLNRALGTSAFGPNFEMPSRLADAFVILQTEAARVDRMKMKADQASLTEAFSD